MSVLIVVAHPDDEVLGCGGTIFKFVHDKHEKVDVVILGTGLTSRNNNTYMIDKLRDDAIKANKMLGVTDIRFFDFPDNMFDTVPQLELAKAVEEMLDDYQPDIVITHDSSDLNIDHSLTHRAVMIATRPVWGQYKVNHVLGMEILSSTDWAFLQWGTFHPNVFVNLTPCSLRTKQAAMKTYKTELREFPHPRSLRAIQGNAERWGTYCGNMYAEAFSLIRSFV